MTPVLSNEFLDVQATIECRFTLKKKIDTVKNTEPSRLVTVLQQGDLGKHRMR